MTTNSHHSGELDGFLAEFYDEGAGVWKPVPVQLVHGNPRAVPYPAGLESFFIMAGVYSYTMANLFCYWHLAYLDSINENTNGRNVRIKRIPLSYTVDARQDESEIVQQATWPR